MAANPLYSGPAVPEAVAAPFEERLERGEIVFFPVCPFPLPEGEDRDFLCGQELGQPLHKNISFDPATGQVCGFRWHNPEQARRLALLLQDFAQVSTRWLANALPRYASDWQPDRVSFRPQEEATRRLRLTARNDLLHIDAFPTRSSGGRRILRLFVNVNPTEPRVWVTSETFDRVLERLGSLVGLPRPGSTGWARRLQEHVAGLFPGWSRRTAYDAFMLRFHDFLKTNDEYQDGCPKRYWKFPPGSAWLLFTDGLSHADLRGRFALDHSFFVEVETLALPLLAPVALVERACGRPVLDRAA